MFSYSKLFFVFCLLFFVLDSTHAKVTFRWGVDQNLDHQIFIAKEFARIIKKKTKNRVQVIVDDTYEEDDHRDSIKKGQFHITQALVDKFFTQQPALKFWEVPFLFQSPEHVESYIQSDRAHQLLKKLEDRHKQAIGYTYAGGFLFFLTPKKMGSFSDLKGLGCHFEDGRTFFNYFIKPMAMGIKRIESYEKRYIEDYTRRRVLCKEVLASSVYTSEIKNYNYFTLTRHRVVSRVVMVSRETLGKLSPKDKTVFIHELRKALRRERRLIYKEIDLVVALLKNKGITTYEWSQFTKDKEKQTFAPYLKKLLPIIGSEVKYINKLVKQIKIGSKN